MTDIILSDPIISMLILSAVCMGVLGIYGIRFIRKVYVTLPYSLLMFACAGWAVLYAFDLSTSSLTDKIIIHNLRFLILPFLALLELWLVIEYVKKPAWFSRNRFVLLFTISAFFAILAITSGYHHLFRYDFSIDTTGPFPLLVYTEGAGSLLLNIYSLFILVVALTILLYEANRKKTLFEIQTFLLFIALAFPPIVNYLFLEGISPVHYLNMTAPLLWIPACLYTIAIFRYRFLEIIPIARSLIIETMRLPMIVLDTEGRLVDYNPAASRVLSCDKVLTKGVPISQIVLDWPDFLRFCSDYKDCTKLISQGESINIRNYLGTSEQIINSEGEREGTLILLQDITEQKNAERELLKSKNKISRMFREAPFPLTITRMSDGLIIEANEGFERISEYLPTDVIGKSILDLKIWMDPDDRCHVVDDLKNNIPISGREYRFRTKTGKIITGLLSSIVIESQDDPYILSTVNDISERKMMESEILALNRVLEDRVQERTEDLRKVNIGLIEENARRLAAERQLQLSLDEKTILLKEVHHRVKNNLQIITSLLNLQSRYIKDESTLVAIRESQNRVRAIALVHEKLYKSESLSRIDFHDYITYLSTSIFQYYSQNYRNIQIILDIKNITVDINTAIPLGLIINELISNSLKYAFPEGRSGKITVSIQRVDATMTLIYSDNGVGLPPGFDWRNTQTLGLRLITALVDQLNGTVELDNSEGSQFTIKIHEKAI